MPGLREPISLFDLLKVNKYDLKFLSIGRGEVLMNTEQIILE